MICRAPGGELNTIPTPEPEEGCWGQNPQSLTWDHPQEKGAHLEVPALGTEPLLDEVLGVSAKTEHEIPLGLQLVNGLNSLVDLGKGVCIRLTPTPTRSASSPNPKGLRSHPQMLYKWKCPTPATLTGAHRRLGPTLTWLLSLQVEALK